MDSFSLKILKKYHSHPSLTLRQLGKILNEDEFSLSEPVSLLKQKGYLRIEHNYSIFEGIKDDDPISLYCPLVLTFRGKTALEEAKKISKKERNAWIRYIITTVISLLAIIISAIALLSELGLIQLRP